MTHRVFSKNASSSRAIPIEKMIQMVQDNPAMPVFWGKNQSGMQAAEELSDVPSITVCLTPENKLSESEIISEREAAKRVWLNARNQAITYVESLSRLGVHKQIANRILEPWLHIRIILSGTEFENWFALRVHKDAQPEICALATKMLELYNASEPKYLCAGDWHIPFGDNIEESRFKPLINNENLLLSNNQNSTSLLNDLKIIDLLID